MQRDDLADYLDECLEAARFRDYCPNGLQVEGRADVQRVVCGVTASQALVDATERYGVQAPGAHLEERWGLSCPYVEIDNPV